METVKYEAAVTKNLKAKDHGPWKGKLDSHESNESRKKPTKNSKGDGFTHCCSQRKQFNMSSLRFVVSNFSSHSPLASSILNSPIPIQPSCLIS